MRKSRPGSADSQATKLLIVRTAQKLFMESGYAAVTTRQIADACGLTQPAIYHHFADKQALYVEVLITITKDTKAAVERIIRRVPDIRECLQQIVYYTFLTMPDDMHQMFHDIEHELTDTSKKIIERSWVEGYLRPIASIFQRGLDSGYLAKIKERGLNEYTAAFLFMNFVSHNHSSKMAEALRSDPDPHKDLLARAELLVDTLLFGMV